MSLIDRTQAAIDAGHPEWVALPATKKEAGLIDPWPADLRKEYFTGAPCRRGHLSPRKRCDGCCVACQQEDDRKPASLARSAANRRAAYAADPAKAEAERERTRGWHRANATYRAAYDASYYLSNPGAAHARAAERRAARLKATPLWLTDDQKAAIVANYTEASRLTRETGISHHVDHIIPLRHPLVCGLHVPWNLQVLSAPENCSKSNSFDGTHENEGWRAVSDALLIVGI